MHTCQYCDHTFTTKKILSNHQQNAKYCLELQGKNPKKYACQCGNEYVLKKSLQRHQSTCVAALYEKSDSEQLHIENAHLSQQINQLQSQIMMLMKPSQQMGNINTTRNVVVNNLQPITAEEIQQHVDHLSLDFILDGAKGYADFANNYPFKDRIICTDKSRRKLQYKDSTGELVNDSHGTKLTQQFFQSIAEKNNELINEEYKALQQQVSEIATCGGGGGGGVNNLEELLSKSINLQNTLRMCTEAAEGKNNELTAEFIRHLSKML